MISAPDRRKIVELIKTARVSGSRLAPACSVTHIDIRTFQRWTAAEKVRVDQRPIVTRPLATNRLTESERQKILDKCHDPEFSSLPPSQLVPRLADKGLYLGSESSFYRVLRDEKEQNRRGRAKPPQNRKEPSSHCATGPNQVWSWDVTWLPGPVRGHFFFLYLFLDVFSRKVVGWEVYDHESADYAATLIQKTVLKENCVGKPLVLHSDNGSPQKGQTMTVMLDRLGVSSSYNRPRVSDDNAYSESIFRTLKYRPTYPYGGFNEISDAQDWVLKFVDWYNHEHCHSGIKFVSPADRHSGKEDHVLKNRTKVYQTAKLQHPERWSREVRNWTPIGNVWLNPTKEEKTSKLKTEAA